MRIFVTGGTGFIGSHFLKLALAEGHEVVGLRRAESQPVIPMTASPEWIEAPLNKVPPKAFEGCEALVHFASQGVSPQPTDWEQAFDVNVTQSLTLFAHAESAGIPHLIACGSCFEYGKSGERYDRIPPDAPLEPVGPYAASKAAFSLALEAMTRSNSSAFSILRPFHLFGEGQHPSNIWPALRKAALDGSNFPMTPGEQIRDFMPVEAAASEFLNALQLDSQPSTLRIRNIGTDHPISISDFASQWWKKWKASGNLLTGALPYRELEVMRFVPLTSVTHYVQST